MAIFAESGVAKKILPKEAVLQKRGGRGLNCYKGDDKVVAAAMVSDEDSILIVGDKTSICVSATDIPALGRTSIGNQMIKGSKVMSVSKV